MASTYLNKTLGSGNKDKWTFSCWVKRHKTGVIHPLLHADDGSSNYYTHISFHDTDQLFFQNRWNNTNDGYKITTRFFRDTSAWYHLQFVWDSGNATADDRQIIYVNGERLTGFSGANVAVTQNRDTTINDAYEHRIGRGDTGMNGSQYADVTLTHVHFTDGYAYAPTVFGETDSTSGIWKPKTAPSVTYGTNGFFLKFANSASLGLDSSGNTNNFTVSGTGTQTEDTPSNNFATLNTLTGATYTGLTIANGNLTIDGNTGTAWRSLMATLGVSTGKWYYEVKVKNLNDNVRIGLIDVDQMLQANGYFNSKARGYAYNNDGQKSNNNSSASYGNSYTTNDIIGIAMDLDNGKLYFSKNGTYQNSGVPTSGSTGTGSAYDISSGYTYAPCIATYTATDKLECNFGNGRFGTTALASSNSDGNGYGLFEYSVPTGYYALCTKNIKLYGG